MNMATEYRVPSFSIYKSPNSNEKVETLTSCYFIRMDIDATNPPAVIKGNDGWVYTCVYDCRMPTGVTVIRAIVSFQQHTYGRFAVIRLAAWNKEDKNNEQ
jgi:hypothetical protein